MRLIDADKLVVDLKEFVENIKNIRDDSKCFLTEENVLSIIEEQPTAYDVDKVVKELKTLSQRACNRRNLPFGNKEYERGRVYAFDDAIDVVKAGGIDE